MKASVAGWGVSLTRCFCAGRLAGPSAACFARSVRLVNGDPSCFGAPLRKRERPSRFDAKAFLVYGLMFGRVVGRPSYFTVKTGMSTQRNTP